MILIIQRGNFEEDINIIWPIRIVGAFYCQIETIDARNLDAGIDWDEKVPDAIEQNIKKWFQELQILDHIKVDRCVQEKEKGIETNIFIHLCSDALELAYGLCSRVSKWWYIIKISCGKDQSGTTGNC